MSDGAAKYGRGPWVFDLDEGIPLYSAKRVGDPMRASGTCTIKLVRSGPSWADDVLIYLCDGAVHEFARRPPARVLRDLALAELVYRDACETQNLPADTVTELLAICNDLRDELGCDLGPAPTVHPLATRHNHRHGIQMPTTSAADVAWSWLVQTGFRARSFMEIRDELTAALQTALGPSLSMDGFMGVIVDAQATATARVEEAIVRVLESFDVVDPQVRVAFEAEHRRMRIRYSGRLPDAIQQVTITGNVEI